jgi:cytoplasmic iron level regulating protein YaaA (DUF328/UPF0246 family)
MNNTKKEIAQKLTGEYILDLLTQKYTGFKTFKELTSAKDFTPTFRKDKKGERLLCHAYNHFQIVAGSDKRAFLV